MGIEYSLGYHDGTKEQAAEFPARICTCPTGKQRKK